MRRVSIGTLSDVCTHRGSRHTADNEVASASEDRFCHDTVVWCVFGARDEASCFLRDHDACLCPPKNSL
jgi:hypothetical protein